MPSSNVSWGIEIGSGAVKALKVAREGDGLKVLDFVVVPHPKPLSSPDIDETDAKRVALGTLASQKNLGKASIAISAPGNAAFARFAKLPPVEPKKVPDIVKFEAVQQIPFPIEEVEWDYQTFVSEDSPDVEVGIFAITREKVMDLLRLCGDVGLRPDFINVSPVSVYNAIAYDLRFSATTPGTVMVDVGTSSTDIIIAESGRVWIRTFPVGGHAFTEALVSAFKLPYAKAEKLKRDAEQSKHKRQVFQAMRPAFADFAQEVQRSINYYQQLHPNADLKRLVGMGSTFRLLGLRKFVSQQVGIEAVRVSDYQRLHVDGAAESDFQSVALNFATAYGLALQGLGLQTIDANLMPVSVTREAMWKAKTPWFAAAATVALVAGGVSFIAPTMDSRALADAKASPDARAVAEVERKAKQLKDEAQTIASAFTSGAAVVKIERLVERRDVASAILRDVATMLASADPQPEILAGAGHAVARDQWRFFEVRKIDLDYRTPTNGAPAGPDSEPRGRDAGAAQPDSPDARDEGFGGAQARPSKRRSRRGAGEEGDETQEVGAASAGSVLVTLVVDTHNAQQRAFLDSTIVRWLAEHATRPGVEYTFDPPTQAEISMEVIAPGAPGGRQTERAGGAGFGRAGESGADALGGGRGAGTLGGDALRNPARLDDIAPLSLPEAPAVTSPTYRFTVQWKVNLFEPGGAPAEAPAAEAGAEEPVTSAEEATR